MRMRDSSSKAPSLDGGPRWSTFVRRVRVISPPGQTDGACLACYLRQRGFWYSEEFSHYLKRTRESVTDLISLSECRRRGRETPGLRNISATLVQWALLLGSAAKPSASPSVLLPCHSDALLHSLHVLLVHLLRILDRLLPAESSVGIVF